LPCSDKHSTTSLPNGIACATRAFTSRLGPLPASAAIAIGLIGSAADKVDRGWIAAAGTLFVILICVSGCYSGFAPYRLRRGKLQGNYEPCDGNKKRKTLGFGYDPAVDLPTWLHGKIKLEEKICGPLPTEQKLSLRRSKQMNLQDALDVERSALLLVQGLFAEIIAVLVLGIFMHGEPPWTQWLVGGVVAVPTVIILFWSLVVSPRRETDDQGGESPS
jgi:hypothetical protein